MTTTQFERPSETPSPEELNDQPRTLRGVGGLATRESLTPTAETRGETETVRPSVEALRASVVTWEAFSAQRPDLKAALDAADAELTTAKDDAEEGVVGAIGRLVHAEHAKQEVVNTILTERDAIKAEIDAVEGELRSAERELEQAHETYEELLALRFATAMDNASGRRNGGPQLAIEQMTVFEGRLRRLKYLLGRDDLTPEKRTALEEKRGDFEAALAQLEKQRESAGRQWRAGEYRYASEDAVKEADRRAEVFEKRDMAAAVERVGRARAKYYGEEYKKPVSRTATETEDTAQPRASLPDDLEMF